MNNQVKHFDCVCNSLRHVLRVEFYDNEVVFEVLLNPMQSFFQRVKTAFRFVFFPTNVSNFGGYDCVILNKKEDCKQIISVLERVE